MRDQFYNISRKQESTRDIQILDARTMHFRVTLARTNPGGKNSRDGHILEGAKLPSKLVSSSHC